MRGTRVKRERTEDLPKPGRKHRGSGKGVSHGMIGGGIYWATRGVRRMAKPGSGIKRRRR